MSTGFTPIKIMLGREVNTHTYLMFPFKAGKGKSRKLYPPWKSPGPITKATTPYLYRVKTNNAIFTVNHDKMKPCRDRSTRTDVYSVS